MVEKYEKKAVETLFGVEWDKCKEIIEKEYRDWKKDISEWKYGDFLKISNHLIEKYIKIANDRSLLFLFFIENPKMRGYVNKILNENHKLKNIEIIMKKALISFISSIVEDIVLENE